jgi:DNA-directed RNA polymerase subunit K/omega
MSNKTFKRMTNFEKTAIIGARASQLQSGAQPLVNVESGLSFIDIAKKELLEKKLNIVIKRQILDTIDYVNIHDLIIF